MSNSIRSPFAGKPASGTVTVLETHVLRTSSRDAKIAAWTVGLITGVLTAAISASYIHPILSIGLGALVGYALGCAAWALVKAWFILRRIWWWATELVLGGLLATGWTVLASHTNLVLRLLVTALVVGGLAAVPATRRFIAAVYHCLEVRHRLRVCFTQFIVRSRSGSLPLILLARPTPVGERVWIFLRPGLSQADIEQQLDRIAATCWAKAVLVERPRDNAAFLRIDVKRREVLTHTIPSPLTELVDPSTPPRLRTATPLPTALNLADVPADVPLIGTYRPSPKPNVKKPETAPPSTNGTATPADNEWI